MVSRRVLLLALLCGGVSAIPAQSRLGMADNNHSDAAHRTLQETPTAGCVSVRSCEDLASQGGGWPTSNGDAAICAESDAGFADGCVQDGWTQAQATCYEVGARLCTITEIITGETRGTGCSHDNRQVWSSTACVDGPGMQATLGRGTSDATCQPDLSAALAIRCCADAAAVRQGAFTCDAYGAGRSDCTSGLSCAELAHRDGGSQALGAWPSQDAQYSLGSPEVCGESDAGFGPAFSRQCYDSESWADAYEICVRAGARLCDVEEIAADETRGTGCSHDVRMIWTADDVGCQRGEHVQAPGSITCSDCALNGWDTTVSACHLDTDVAAVRCCADAVVGTPCALSAPENLDQLPGVTVALGNTVETDTDILVSPGDPRCASQGCGFRGGSPSTIVDMSHAPDEWTSSPYGDSPDCSTRLYVTVDLGMIYPVDGVTIWHYHGDDRSYCGQKVALSATGQFTGEEIVVFDTGQSYGATESEQGNPIVFDMTAARYVRHWCGRSDHNTGIHFMEMDVYGMAVPQSVHASIPDKLVDLPFLGDAADHSAFARSVMLHGDSRPTASGMHFDGDGDWVTVQAFDYASDAAFSINFWLRKGDCTGNRWEMLFSDASTSDTIPYTTQFAYAAEHHASWFDLYIGCDPQTDSTKADGTVPGGSIMRAWMMDVSQTMAVFDYALHEAGQFDEITRAWTSVTYAVSPTAVVTHTDGSRAAVTDYSFVSGFVNDPEGYGTRLPNAAYPNPQALVSPFSGFNLLGNDLVIGNRNDATLTREFSGKIALFALYDVTLTDAQCTNLFFMGESTLTSLGPEMLVIPPSCVSTMSCEELARNAGRGSWPTGRGDPNVCAESDAGIDGGCAQNGWLEAQATCYEVGARLCTVAEIAAGETQGTGCSHDYRQVWSSSLCNAADGVGMQTAMGSDGSHAQCQNDLSVSAAIRCCADMEQVRLTKSPCDFFASEESDCTSVLACEQLAERDGQTTSWPTQNGNAAVCGESDAGLGEHFTRQCFAAEQWGRAHNICVHAGARLCTVEELHADETKGTGCSFDLEMIWSINDIGCNAHEHVMVPGATTCTGCDPYATPYCAADESDGAVRCCADAVVGTPCELEPVENLDQLPGVTVALGNTVETDTDILVSPGDPRCASQGCGFRGGSPSTIVDMSHAPDEWTSSPYGDSPDCSTRLYVTVDLQENYPVTGVTIWHYHGDDRSYCGQKVALSATGQFTGEEIVVFDTGQSYGATETERGKAIVFDRIVARYVRHWCGRSDRNTGIHFMEMDVYGAPVPAHPLDLCPMGATLEAAPLGGTAVEGQQCVFPFTYEGRVYNACTDVNYAGTPWCSVDADYAGNWGACECTSNFHSGMCGITTGLVTTTGGTAPEDSVCVFPFEYEGVSYNQCTHAGCTGAGCSHWCSTTAVYSDQWGNCVCSPTQQNLGPADCTALPDGTVCETGTTAAAEACHAGICDSISWTRVENQDCAKFVPITAHGQLTSLADAEAACRAQRNCGGVADSNCDGATGADTFRLCLGARTTRHEVTCMWPAPPRGGH